MADTPAITDRNLEATTNISLKREPACFAFLSPRSISPPMPIDSINLDLASADYFGGRASLWAALEMRSSVSDERPTAILGFDETFLRPFARALIEAATTRAAYRMSILQESRTSERCRVVEYVTGPGKALEELMLQPFDNVVLISAAKGKDGDETLFQFARKANVASNIGTAYFFERRMPEAARYYRLAVELGIPMIGMLRRKAEKVIIDTALKGLKNRVESLPESTG